MAIRTSRKTKPAALLFDTPEALRLWGKRLAALLRKGDVVALVGPLGAGKTTLVQGIAEGRGYKRGANSPTFAIANEYETSRGTVYHMDVYRLSSSELAAFPIEDYWQDGICLIEWADRIRNRWPPELLEIRLAPKGARCRALSIHRPSALWKQRLASFSSERRPLS